jgi:formylmethanofuran dehydrogenase subunit E
MGFTDNPVADFERHDSEQERRLKEFPMCSCCDEYIFEDYYYQINDEIICVHCLNEYYRKDVDDYF